MTHHKNGTKHATRDVQHERKAHLLTMRWVFLIIFLVWALATFIVPVVVFFLTRSLLSFSLFSPLRHHAICGFGLPNIFSRWTKRGIS